MTITPDQFFGKYDQKGIDFDKNGEFWCVDLYRQFVKEVLGFPQSPLVEGAEDVWDTYLKDYFDRIDNTLTAVPIKGDIIIWSNRHIAVCKDGNLIKFTSFDQNYPTGTLCHFQSHSYLNVYGWLRPKAPEPVPTTTMSSTSSTTTTTSSTSTTTKSSQTTTTTTLPENPPQNGSSGFVKLIKCIFSCCKGVK